MGKKPLIDLQKLVEMRDLSTGDQDFARELIRIFRQELPKALNEIEACLSVQNIEKVGQIAHTCKSSCGTVGATAMQEAFILLEEGAERGQPEAVRDSYSELVSLYPATLEAFEKWLKPKSLRESNG